MKINKKEISEIIGKNGELIGNDDIPKNGSDLETQANGTTDDNVNISHQPYAYDMMGRFGFFLMPFMEGKENDVINYNDAIKLSHELLINVIEYYYKNPNKLKSDYRLISSNEKSDFSDNVNKYWTDVIVNIVKKYEQKKNIEENTIIEDVISDKKSEIEISNKSEDLSIKDKKLMKVAGLINKLDKKDIDKLVNLLEYSNGK